MHIKFLLHSVCSINCSYYYCYLRIKFKLLILVFKLHMSLKSFSSHIFYMIPQIILFSHTSLPMNLKFLVTYYAIHFFLSSVYFLPLDQRGLCLFVFCFVILHLSKFHKSFEEYHIRDLPSYHNQLSTGTHQYLPPESILICQRPILIGGII